MANNMETYNYRSMESEVRRDKTISSLVALESTEGYWLLTPKQRQIIRVSLFIQERAERGMHPSHKNDSWYYDWKKENSYQKSLDHIGYWYCHAAVSGLEKEKYSGTCPPPCSHEFFNGQYFIASNVDQVSEVVEEFGFPCVVHIGGENGNFHGETNRYHTFLALGHDQDGKILIWEKIRKGEPYRIATLNDVFKSYGKDLFWGVRKIAE